MRAAPEAAADAEAANGSEAEAAGEGAVEGWREAGASAVVERRRLDVAGGAAGRVSAATASRNEAESAVRLALGSSRMTKRCL